MTGPHRQPSAADALVDLLLAEIDERHDRLAGHTDDADARTEGAAGDHDRELAS